MVTIRRAMFYAAACLVLPVAAAPVHAATFYVDPVAGSPSGDGSAANPWRTLQEVFAGGLIQTRSVSGAVKNPAGPVKAGDTLLLRSGYHGDINTSQWFNDDYITVAAEDGHTPMLRRLRLSGASKWVFRGLTISPSAAPTYTADLIVQFYSRTSSGECSDITIEDCFIYSQLDSSAWSAQEWIDLAPSGIDLGMEGHRLTARGNRLLNVAFAISGQAEDSLIEHNEITNFRGDGIRVCYHGITVQYNLIRNCYDVDDNHDDGIQGFLANVGSGTVRDVTLRGNIIINRTDPDQPHPGPLQGIGIFDGPLVNWVVENNIVITDHWHGITLYRADGCRIVNNTVFNPWYQTGQSGLYTWIDMTPESGGAVNYIRNNLCPRIVAAPGTKVVIDHNLEIPPSGNPYFYFVDYTTYDYHLAPTCTLAIDAGISAQAPAIDADEFLRPAGTAVDIGAYEYGSGPDVAVVADAGPDQTVYDTDGDGMATFTLDGSGSVGNNGALVKWEWMIGFSVLRTGETAEMTLPVGVCTLTLRATDEFGSSATDDVEITIETGSRDGDADGDGDVDLDDFVILKTHFGTVSGATHAEGDFDGDGDVDLDDFVVLKTNFGS